jgi:hypothetical protein
MSEPHATCRVYWGSHGCCLPRGHEGEHLCTCSFEDDDPVNGALLPHANDSEPEDGHASNGNVGRAPYYGPDTIFYGEDAAAMTAFERVDVRETQQEEDDTR